jgi:hypothetical protein
LPPWVDTELAQFDRSRILRSEAPPIATRKSPLALRHVDIFRQGSREDKILNEAVRVASDGVAA